MIPVKTKDPLMKKYLQKDDLISDINRPIEIARKGISFIKTPADNDTQMFCPACIRVQIKARMFMNIEKHWECRECHNSIDPSDLGLKPYQEDEITAVNDPYRQPIKIYTPTRNLLRDFHKTEILKHKAEGSYKMFDKKKFDSMQEAMTAKL